MNITVYKTNFTDFHSMEFEYGYAVNDLEIYVDETQSQREQIITALHEYIENKFSYLTHDKVEECENEIRDILRQLLTVKCSDVVDELESKKYE